MQMHSPAHPGEMVRLAMGEGLTVTALAAHLGVPREHLSKVLSGKRAVTPRLALRLEDAFPRLDAEYWLRLQSQYELAELRKVKRKRLKPLLATA
ncbi:MAG TPA: HigA family addiction module antitoxin [Acidobacteriaceae bacterium]